MPYSSLRDFIDHLESNGRLVRVSAPVSPELEITEIQTRLLAEEGPAVLFENVVGTDGRKYGMPVLANLFGTTERVAWGLTNALVDDQDLYVVTLDDAGDRQRCGQAGS